MARKYNSDLYDILFETKQPVRITGRNKSVYGVVEFEERKVSYAKNDSSISSFEERYSSRVILKILNKD